MREGRVAVLVLGALGCATMPARLDRETGASDATSTASQNECWGAHVAEPCPEESAAWTDYGPIQCTPPFPQPSPRPRPWDAPSGVSAAVVSMAQRALATGPDPRTLAYHEVEIWQGTVWDHGGRTRAFGFVRPGSAHGERPFVWLFGEWYAAVAVGPPADLAAQCRAHLAGMGPPPLRSPPYASRWSAREPSIREQTFCPSLSAVIALSAEEPQLALRLATQIAAQMAEHERSVASAARATADETLGWRLALGDLARALMAHMQGDDCLALQLLRENAPVDDAPVDDAPSDGLRRGLDAHETLRNLRADQERRATTPRSVVPEIPAEGPVPADFVPALIASLDEVDALQLSQPGGVALGDALQVAGLVRVGPAAVPALIDTIENDARLTRSVGFFRDFAPHRYVVSVRDVAGYVLEQIVGTSFPIDGDLYRMDSPSSWSRFAAHLRAWWGQPAERGVVDRSLAMLRDDRLDAAAWADAATWIRGTYYAWREPGTSTVRSYRAGRPPHDVAPTERLGALLIRRAHDSLRAGAAPEACSLARTAWNADESVLPELVAFANRCARARTCPCLDDLAASLGPSIPAIVDAAERRHQNARSVQGRRRSGGPTPDD